MKNPINIFYYLTKMLLLSGMIFFFQHTKAQLPSVSQPNVFLEKGFVVKHENDTLWGEIKVLSGMGFVQKILFKDKNGNKFKYTPNDILAFGQKRIYEAKGYSSLKHIDRKMLHYESRPHPEKIYKNVFMERLMTGNRLVLFSNPTGMNSEQNSNGFTDAENSVQYIIIKNKDTPIYIKKKDFEWKYDKIFTDCESFEEFINENITLKSFRYLALLIENYNQLCD